MVTVGILGGDRRMACLAQMMAEDGYSVRCWGVADTVDNATLEDAAAAERIVLPVPLCRSGQLTGTDLELGTLWRILGKGRRVYAGAAGEDERRTARLLGIHITDYMEDEALAVRNAVPTAEGAIACAMEHTEVTLFGAPCLVTGFGRIGKLLALRLVALGARVSVCARKRADRAWAEAMGCETLSPEELAGRAGDARVIFNTVPALLFDGAALRALRPDCLLLELSSRDGFDREAVQAMGLKYIRAAGLPGKAAPETAARAIRDALYSIWEAEE